MLKNFNYCDFYQIYNIRRMHRETKPIDTNVDTGFLKFQTFV